MNKIIKNSFGVVILLSSVFFLNSCSDSETIPSNIITDTDGITVDLDWSTGTSASAALEESDLDLYIYKNSTKVLSGTNSYSFEQQNIDTDLHADGTYTVAVYSYKVGKATTYTVTIDGVTVSKPYTFNSNYASGDTQHEISVLTIVKAGSKYTVTTVN